MSTVWRTARHWKWCRDYTGILVHTPHQTRHWSRRPTAYALLRLSGAAHRGRSGAPFNGARDCAFREPYMDNGMRTMQRAARGGTSWGPKPVKKRTAVAPPRGGDRSSPATSADARDLWVKRRDAGGGKRGCDTPAPKGHGGGPGKSERWPALLPSRPASRRPRRVALGAGVGTGELPHRFPYGVGHDNARVREGGRRRRNSHIPRCNGGDRVQVRQAWWTEPASDTRTWGRFPRGSLGATSAPMALGGALCSRAVSNHRAGKRRASQAARSVWSGGKAAKPYLSLPSRVAAGVETLGLR